MNRIKNFFAGLGQAIVVTLRGIYNFSVAVVVLILWVALSTAGYVGYKIYNAPAVEKPAMRTYAESPPPVVFSRTLNKNESTVAEGLSTQHRLDRMVRSVVSVETFGEGNKKLGSGSGVILDNVQCIVVTNDHVISRDGQIRVKMVTAILANGEEVTRTVNADVVGYPSRHEDLALLKLESCQGMPWAFWLNANKPERGTTTIAIGHPFSNGWTSTFGTVSHKARFWDRSTVSGFGLIQTDAAINPGNSGGGLFAEGGRLVGINSMGLVSSGSNVSINNIGVARSITSLYNYVRHMQTTGRMIPPNLKGLEYKPLTSSNGQFGIGVIGVDDEPGFAYIEGAFQPADIIVGVNQSRMLTFNGFKRLLWMDLDGIITLWVVRKGKMAKVVVNLRHVPQSTDNADDADPSSESPQS